MADPSERHVVVYTEHLDDRAVRWLRERCDVIACADDDEAFVEHALHAHGIIVRSYTTVDSRFLDRAPNCRVIGRAGVGLSNIDVDACHARNIEVVHTPESNTQAVVEYVLRILMPAIRPLHTLTQHVDASTWLSLRATYVGDRQLDECTVGVLGFGRIGSRIGPVMRAIGARVLYHDLREIPASDRHGCAPAGFDELIRASDVLTIHVDGRASNRHLLDEQAFAWMRPDAVVVNTSRGFVVDDAALSAFLRDNPQAQACIDVHDPEPPRPDAPLFGVPNAALYPHLASRTQTAMARMSDVVEDVWAVLRGQMPRWPAGREAE